MSNRYKEIEETEEDKIARANAEKARLTWDSWIEDMEEKDIENEITKLKSLLEEFANGGFDLIRSKKEEEPSFFLNENCFLDLLD